MDLKHNEAKGCGNETKGCGNETKGCGNEVLEEGQHD